MLKKWDAVPGNGNHSKADVVHCLGIINFATALDNLENHRAIEEHIAYVHAEHYEHADTEVSVARSRKWVSHDVRIRTNGACAETAPSDEGAIEQRERDDMMDDHDRIVALLRVEEKVSVEPVQVPPDLRRVVQGDLGSVWQGTKMSEQECCAGHRSTEALRTRL